MQALPTTEAYALHRELLATWRQHTATEHHAAHLLARIDRTRSFVELGHTSTIAYAVATLDLDPRRARDLLRLGRALPALPKLDQAFAQGDIGWTKVRELIRVATPDNEAAWLHAAQQVSNRQLEQMVVRTQTGGDPPDQTDPERGPARTRIVFEVDGPSRQVVLDALALLKSQCGPDADRAELFVAICQRILHDAEAPQAPSTERHRIVLQHCPDCSHTTGLDHEAPDTLTAMACCDAEVLDVRPGADQGNLTRTIPARTRRLVEHRDAYRCAVPDCTCTLWLDVHHLHHFAEGGDHHVDNLTLLCAGHHRLVHDGLLALQRQPDGVLSCTFADGRRSALAPRRRPLLPVPQPELLLAVPRGSGPQPPRRQAPPSKLPTTTASP